MKEAIEIIIAILIGFFATIGIITVASGIYLAIKGELIDWSEKRRKAKVRHSKQIKRLQARWSKKRKRKYEKALKITMREIRHKFFKGVNEVTFQFLDEPYFKRIAEYLWKHDFGDWLILKHNKYYNGDDCTLIFDPDNGKYMDVDTIRTWVKEKTFGDSLFSTPEFEEEFMGTEEDESSC